TTTTVATTSAPETTTTVATTSTIAETTTSATEATTIEQIVTEETTETAATHIASDEDLCDWAIVDYEDKTGVTAADAQITNEANGQYEITLTDQNDKVLDVYIIDPNTGTGVEVNHNEEVNLPQTGNNSLTNLLIAVGAFMMAGIGFYTVKASGVIRRKEE
ncbi:MAG: LPXTG cell wall anchor domain-containing protein, partial [Oscillospiraceae bacterium]|nr:LPXTG cell wall anchor domain-containing protein [Oscillospiraceae bacterium]